MNIYLDIETIPGQAPGLLDQFVKDVAAPGQFKKPESIKEWLRDNAESAGEEAWRKTSFDGAFGHIAVIGFAIGDDEPTVLYGEQYGSHEVERDILGGFFAAIDAAAERMLAGGTRSSPAPIFIGHNVVEFDLRFLFQRAVMLGVRPPACIPFDARPWDKTVFDTMIAWAGARNRASLDKLCKAFGIADKGSEIGEEIDGSMVWDFVKEGRIADVAKYCAGDVERVRHIHKRLTFAQVA